MFNSKILKAVFLSLLSFGTLAFADDVNPPIKDFQWSVYERPPIVLGSAYDHQIDRFVRSVCVESPIVHGEPVGSVKLSLHSDYDETTSTLGLDVGARFRTTVAGGSAAAKLSQTALNTGYSVTILYKMEAQVQDLFDPGAGNNITPKANFKSYVEKDDKINFQKSCGTEFVINATGTAGLIIQVTVNFTSKEAAHEFELKVDGDFNSGAMSGGANADLKTLEKSISKRSSVEMTVLQIGGNPGLSGQALCPAALADATPDLSKCGEAVVKCVSGKFDRCEDFMQQVIGYAGGSFPSQLKDEKGKFANYAYTAFSVAPYSAAGKYPHPTTAGDRKSYDSDIHDLNTAFEKFFTPWVQANNSFMRHVPRPSAKQLPVLQTIDSTIKKLLTTINNGVNQCYNEGLQPCETNRAQLGDKISDALKAIADKVKSETGEAITLGDSTALTHLVDAYTTPENFTQFCDTADDQHAPRKYAFDVLHAALVKEDADRMKALDDASDYCFALNDYLKDRETLVLDGTSTATKNVVMDVAPFAKLPNLKNLTITNANIMDVSPLGGLLNLESLNLSQNKISNICPLFQADKPSALTKITAKGNKIASIDCLRGHDVKVLDVRSNKPKLNCNSIGVPNCKDADMGNLLNHNPLANTMTDSVLGVSSARMGNGLVLVSGGVFESTTNKKDGDILPAGGEYNVYSNTMSYLAECDNVSCTPFDKLKDPRSFATSSLDPNSGNVVIAGGGTNSIEIYNPTSHMSTLLQTQKLSEARSGHTATVLKKSGLMVFIGGYGSTDPKEFRKTAPLSTFDVFDPAKGRFLYTRCPLKLGRVEHTATELSDGTILVIGGFSPNEMIDQMELVNPLSCTSQIVGHRMNIARSGHAAIPEIANGKITVLGGFTWNKSVGQGPQFGATDTVEVLNLKSLSFDMSAEVLSSARGGVGVAEIASGKYLLIGGTNANNLVDSFKVCHPKWVQKPNDPTAGDGKLKQPDAKDAPQDPHPGQTDENKCADRTKIDNYPSLPGDTSASAAVDIYDTQTAGVYGDGALSVGRAGMSVAPVTSTYGSVLVLGGAGSTPAKHGTVEVLVWQ